MLEIGFEADEAVRGLEGIPKILDRQRPQLLVRAVTAIKNDAHTDLLVKANGGTGIDGTKWKAVTPAEAKRKQRLGQPLIGIRSGQMLAKSNLQIRQRGEEVLLEFGPGEAEIEKAALFDAERPLFPTQLPREWYQHATREVQQETDTLFNFEV